MTVAITRTLADTYFSTRIDDERWKAFKTGMRDKAIVSAKDVLGRSLGSQMTGETSDSASSYYPDRAVYHQALYMLQNSDAVVNGEQTGSKWVGTSDDGKPVPRQSIVVCSEARRWMNWQAGSTVRLARG